jgi:membrane protease YdiL (CAAX protease family)
MAPQTAWRFGGRRRIVARLSPLRNLPVIVAVHKQPGRWWSFLQFPLTRILLASIAVLLWGGALQAGAKALRTRPESPLGVSLGLLMMVGVLAVYAGYVRLIERRAVIELGAAGAPLEFAAGALVGAALFCSTMLLLWMLGAWRLTGTGRPGVLVYPLVGSLIGGCLEEVLMRGVLFRIIEESLGSWIALGLSALIFGLLHAFNPGAGVVSTLAISLEAGVLLAAAYMYARRLWLVIGLHAAWNFTEGGIFGADVSGGQAHGLLTVQFQGSDALTGGRFGPEASIVAVLVCLAAGAGFIILARRTSRIVPPVWRHA